MNLTHGIEILMVLQISLGTSILIQGSLYLSQGGRNRESFWKTFRRTCWMKQRTANNNFNPWTINFHKQVIDIELIAVESHTWQFWTNMYKACIKMREVWYSSFTQVSWLLLEEALANILLQKLPGLTVQRAAGSNTGCTANERNERNALARERQSSWRAEDLWWHSTEDSHKFCKNKRLALHSRALADQKAPDI